MKSGLRYRLSLVLRSALAAFGLIVLGELAGGIAAGLAQGYPQFSMHMFWRLLAGRVVLGAELGVAFALLVSVQILLLGLLVQRPRRAVFVCWGGWSLTVLFFAVLPGLLGRFLHSLPEGQLPYFARDAASMQAFITRIIGGVILPERLFSNVAVRPGTLLVPLLLPLLLGSFFYLVANWPVRRWLGEMSERGAYRTVWLAWIALTLVALVLPVTAADWSRPEKSKAPNLVLISVDTLRADAMGAYGAEPSATPHLDDLAREGTLFTDVRAPSSWTLPSHAALFTGRWPWRLGVRKVQDALGPEAVTLAEALAARGFDTYSVVTHLFVDVPYGMGQGFDRVDHALTERADEAARLAVRWLKEQRRNRRPFFLFVHLYDPHWPYDPQGNVPSTLWAETTLSDRLRVLEYDDFFDLIKAMRQPYSNLATAAKGLYLGEVWMADRAAGKIVDAVKRIPGDTIVAVVADHGEMFGEHGMYGHGITLFEPEVRVPWILFGAGVAQGGRVGGTVSLVDVAPTLLALAGCAGDLTAADGLDLSAAARGGTPPTIERWVAGENMFLSAEPSRYLANGFWKWFGGVELNIKGLAVSVPAYTVRIDQDPAEQTDVTEPGILAMTGKLVEALFAGETSSGIEAFVGESELEHLRNLGYLP